MRLGIAVAGASAADVVSAARAAEAANADVVLVGDVAGRAANRDDTYVLTAAAAAASATAHLRIGIVLSLRGSAPLLRVTEDLGVLDVASGGRIELLLAPDTDRADLDAVLGGWSGWPLPDGSTVPVTPAPVQPFIPAWLVSADARSATSLHGGPAVLLLRRTDLPPPDAGVLHGIRRDRDQIGASTVVVDVGAIPTGQRRDVIRMLGTVMGPCLRCPAEEVDILALDSVDWLLRRTELHHPPLPQ